MSKQHDINMKILLGSKQAAECLVLPPNQKIVDVATGIGTLAYEFAKLVEPQAKITEPLIIQK